MRLFLFSFISIFFLSGCFKDNPKKDIQRFAGSWEIENAQISYFKVNGEDSLTSEIADLGFLHFYYTDDFLFENSFSQTLSANYVSMNNSVIKQVLDGSNIWWVSVGSKNVGFGLMDYQTGYVTTTSIITLKRKSNKSYQFVLFTKHSNGKLKSHEVWNLKRD